ncbi:Cyclic nucleotide-binding domain [Phytophthora infestans]|uniref:Cyclic nucleotide-binding domain n=1 Tax=Phytophthora infestans TaxID=4787 RepID=A0A833S0F0_PHYIN|nr:Cyclic nucleotide-binding domain [Phytophthora infestans]
MRGRSRRRSLVRDVTSSGSFYGYIGELRSAFDPNSVLLQSWHQLLFGCLLYEAFLLPFVVTFATKNSLLSSTAAFRVFYGAEFLFCADFYVALNTGSYEVGNIHRDKGRARAKYLKSVGFFLDIVAIIPLSLVLPVANTATFPQGIGWPGWLEFHKLLRVRRVPGYLSNLDNVYAKYFRALKWLKVLVATAFVAHVIACGRFAFGWRDRSAQVSDGWLPLGSESLDTQYVQALFWSVGLLTGAFEGALPRRNSEFLFTLTVMLLGFVLFVYACSTLFMLSKSESNQTVLAQARINQLRHLLTFHGVPETLQTEAMEYLKRHYTDAESNDREVVKLLCPSITKDIQVELLKDMVGRIPLFRGCNQQFMVALTSLLEMTSFPAHVTLFEAGDQGDYMYVVNSGVLHILVNGVKVRELRQGSFFGEVSVFSKRPRSAAVVTTSYCTLYRLSRFHTERVMEGYPDCAAEIASSIDEMVNERETAKSSHGGGEEYMLTTLLHLSSKSPIKKKRPSLRDRAKKARSSLVRRKSTRALSSSRHSEYDGGNASMSEQRARNFTPTPIVLPSKVMATSPETAKLVRSQSAYPDRESNGTNWWPQRAASLKSSTSIPPDSMQGFYDNLSRRRGSQQLADDALSRVFCRLLMRRVVDHSSRWRKYWLIVLQVHLAANCFIVSLLLCFPILDCPMINRGAQAGYVLMDILLGIDMYLNFHLTYTTGRKKVTDPSLVVKHYLRGSFVPDLLCCIPYRLLVPLGGSTVLLTHPALLRLPVLLRVWHIKGHLKEWETSFRLSRKGWFLAAGMAYLLSLHLVACVYFSLTYVEGFGGDSGDESWLPTSELSVRLCVDHSDGMVYYYESEHSNTSYAPTEAHAVAGMQYTRALYFAATMLTTLGKTVEPSSTLQYSVALVFMLCGFLSMAVMVDMMQTRITASAFEQKEFLVTRTRVQRFIKSRTVPSGVQQRVKSFLDFWWSCHRGAVAGDLLNDLPETIKRPVLRSMCQSALRTLSLLADVRPSLDALEQVFVDNVRFILYGQGEVIYRQGDYASGLFFLLEGELIIIVDGGAPRTLVKGGFIGTAALNLSETSVSYAERVTAASGCILLFLSRDHLNGMHKVFPTFSMALRALEKRLEGAKLARVQQDFTNRERSFSGGVNPISAGTNKATLETKALRYLGLGDIIFDPDETSSEMWNLWIFALTIALYVKVIGETTAGVDANNVVQSEVVAAPFEVFFALDFFFHSRLGYYEYGSKVMDIFTIRERFFRSPQCWCGILALIPLYTVNWLVGWSNRHEMLSINKLLRLFQARKTFLTLEEKHVSRTLQVRLIKLVLLSFMLAHAFGCIWFSFKSSSREDDAWTPSTSLQTADKHVQYSALLFWSFGLMSNSYAGELPKTEAQCCVAILVLLSGALLFAYVIGNISDVVELIDANSREFNAKLSSLRLLLAHFHLPSSIQEQLKTYFFFQQYHTITQEFLLERCLPPSLLTEIRLVHLQPMISKVGFLAGMEDSVTRMLVSQFVQALTVKGQFVFRLGEEGSDMFFVFTGIIDVLVPLETVHRRQSHDERINALGSPSRSSFHTVFPTLDPSKLQSRGQLKKVNELTSGSYFGEVALFTSKPRSAHARCKTSCVLYRLPRRSLELVFERYPDWKRKVLKIVNIQQEQQLLRNLNMEEQMDVAVNTSKGTSHVDILGAAASLSKNLSAGSFSETLPQRGTRNTAIRPLGTLKTAGSFFSSYKAQRSVSSDTAVASQLAQQKKDVIWVDMLLQCTDAQSAFHVHWLMGIAVGTVYMALIIPYRNWYDALEGLSPMPIVARALELICEVLFGWDIWVNWNLKDGLEAMELYENKQRDAYQKERLWVDVVAAIPIDHFLADFYQSPLLGLNRCLKLFNFPHYMREINRRSVSYEKNRLCTLWILLFVLVHWCACAYFSIASATSTAETFDDWDNWAPPRTATEMSWTNPPLDLLLLRFLRGIYFASTAFIKRGKVFEPSNYVDYTFSIFADFVGLVVVSFMIGEMANLYVSYTSNEVEFRKNHIAVDLYLERWQITGQLRTRAHAFLSSLWSSHRGVSYQAIFDEIPHVIRTETILHIANLPLRVFINNVFRPFATAHPHDRDVEAITRAIAQHLKYEGYPRDECVIVEGSVSKEMYFVVKGFLRSTTSGGHSEEGTDKSYKKGDYFGEHGLLGYSVGVSTVKTMSACDLLSLSSEDLLQVILSRPLFQTALSLAVEGYRDLSKMIGTNRSSTRRKKWLEEALSFTSGDADDSFSEPWVTSSLKPGKEVGLVTISSPAACVSVFEKLLRLIATRGLLDSKSLHQSTAQFQHTLPVLAADFSPQRTASMSVPETSNTRKTSLDKLSYLH